MNVFKKVLAKQYRECVSLGNPLGVGSGEYHARMHFLAEMRGGKGFRQYSTKVKVGSERGDKRRETRKRVFGLS